MTIGVFVMAAFRGQKPGRVEVWPLLYSYIITVPPAEPPRTSPVLQESFDYHNFYNVD